MTVSFCLLPHYGSEERKDGSPDNILGFPLDILDGRTDSLIFDLKLE